MLLIHTSSHSAELGRLVAEALQCPVHAAKISRFESTGEFEAIVPAEVAGSDVVVLGASGDGSVHEWLFAYLLTVRAARDSAARRIVSLLPYLPYSRSDKKAHFCSALGVGLVIDVVHSAGASLIVTLDMHAHRIIPQLGKQLVNIQPEPALKAVVAEWRRSATAIVAMDAGYAGRVWQLAKELRMGFIQFRKMRLSDETVVVEPVGESLPCSDHAIIVDDAIYTGSTLIECVAALRNAGVADIDLVVTHHRLQSCHAERVAACGLRRIAWCWGSGSCSEPAMQLASEEMRVLDIAQLVADGVRRGFDSFESARW